MMKIIACEIYKTYIEELLDVDEDIVYLDIESHLYPQRLSRKIQEEIDRCQNEDKILLIYGLCGNALTNIHARHIPVYLLRVHDCLSVLLGSKKRMESLFSHRPSQGWSCYSLENRKMFDLEEYDEEDKDYLEKLLKPNKEIYISFGMEEEKKYEKQYKEIIRGDLSFLKDVIQLNSQELLEVHKNDQLFFDEEKVIRKEKKNGYNHKDL